MQKGSVPISRIGQRRYSVPKTNGRAELENWQKVIDTQPDQRILVSRSAANDDRPQQRRQNINIGSLTSRAAPPRTAVLRYGSKGGIKMLTCLDGRFRMGAVYPDQRHWTRYYSDRHEHPSFY